MDPAASIASALTIQLVSTLVESGEWEHIKELLRRGDQEGATVEVDRALADIGTDKLAPAGVSADEAAIYSEQIKKDVRYKTLALASLDERNLLSNVLGWQSAEKVGENLTKATGRL